MKRSGSELFSIISTGALVACAVVLTGAVVRRELRPAKLPPGLEMTFERQPDWARYASVGNRLGPAAAPVVLVEFSDFQCPACRSLEGRLREARKKFPADFAMVYRHWPLSIHKHAHTAAIASECAAKQGRFEQIHAALFDGSDSIGVASWASFATRASVPDLRAFEQCMMDPAVAAIVERDRDAARNLNSRGTPTVLINGVRFAGVVGQAVLDSLVERAVKDGRRRVVGRSLR